MKHLQLGIVFNFVVSRLHVGFRSRQIKLNRKFCYTYSSLNPPQLQRMFLDGMAWKTVNPRYSESQKCTFCVNGVKLYNYFDKFNTSKVISNI